MDSTTPIPDDLNPHQVTGDQFVRTAQESPRAVALSSMVHPPSGLVTWNTSESGPSACTAPTRRDGDNGTLGAGDHVPT